MRIEWLLSILCLGVYGGCSNPLNPDGGNSGVTNVSKTQAPSYAPDLVVDNIGDVFVVWSDSSPGNYEILFVENSLGGCWVSPTTISNTADASVGPQIAVDPSGDIHVVWEEWPSDSSYPIQIYYRARTVQGDWSQPTGVSDSVGFEEQPRIAADGAGNIHLIWRESGVEYCSKPPGGSWSAPVSVWGGGLNPSLAVEADGPVHVVFEEMLGGNSEIFYVHRAAGDTWSDPVNVSNKPGYSCAPDIGVSPTGDVYVIWYEQPEQKAYSTVRPAGSMSFQTPVVVPGISNVSKISVDNSGTIHVAWEASGETFYMSKAAGGQWSTPQNVSNTTGRTIGIPHIASGTSGKAHIVWSDDTPGNADIYYAVVP